MACQCVSREARRLLYREESPQERGFEGLTGDSRKDFFMEIELEPDV